MFLSTPNTGTKKPLGEVELWFSNNGLQSKHFSTTTTDAKIFEVVSPLLVLEKKEGFPIDDKDHK